MKMTRVPTKSVDLRSFCFIAFFALPAILSAQADINDFLKIQIAGKRVFIEYDYQMMLDSIDSLNANGACSNLTGYSGWLSSESIPGESVNELSGFSVAISGQGNVLASGAPFNGNNGPGSGATRVYMLENGSWSQRGQTIYGDFDFDTSGSHIAMSNDGDVLAIGAPHYDSGNGLMSGLARVFRYVALNNTWIQVGGDIIGENASDVSGYNIALSDDGNTLAVGAPNNSANGASAGHVRVFGYDENSAAWSQLGQDVDGEAADDLSGYSVSLSGDGGILAIGAVGNDGVASDAGHVRIYAINNGAWVQEGQDIGGENAGDNSGHSVSLSGDGSVVAIGAPNNDGSGSNAGHVRIYSFDNGVWSQKGADIDGEANDDLSGWSVSLSSDGETLAIGAKDNDGGAPDSGHVRVYSFETGSWSQRAGDIDGDAGNDKSGTSISMSSDGNTLAIGAPNNDDAQTDAGQVKVLRYVSGE